MLNEDTEEEIKAALFSRPSPSPTHLGEIDEESENKFDSEREVSEEIILGQTSTGKCEEVSTSTPTNMSSVTSMKEQPQSSTVQPSEVYSDLGNENLVLDSDLLSKLASDEFDLSSVSTQALSKFYDKLVKHSQQVDIVRNKLVHAIFGRVD